MNVIQKCNAMAAGRMTSLEIAEVTGKLHKHLMRDIRNMEAAWEKVNGSKFGLVDYRDAKGELRPCYSLSKTECLYIATRTHAGIIQPKCRRLYHCQRHCRGIRYGSEGSELFSYGQEGSEMAAGSVPTNSRI